MKKDLELINVDGFVYRRVAAPPGEWEEEYYSPPGAEEEHTHRQQELQHEESGRIVERYVDEYFSALNAFMDEATEALNTMESRGFEMKEQEEVANLLNHIGLFNPIHSYPSDVTYGDLYAHYPEGERFTKDIIERIVDKLSHKYKIRGSDMGKDVLEKMTALVKAVKREEPKAGQEPPPYIASASPNIVAVGGHLYVKDIRVRKADISNIARMVEKLKSVKIEKGKSLHKGEIEDYLVQLIVYIGIKLSSAHELLVDSVNDLYKYVDLEAAKQDPNVDVEDAADFIKSHAEEMGQIASLIDQVRGIVSDKRIQYLDTFRSQEFGPEKIEVGGHVYVRALAPDEESPSPMYKMMKDVLDTAHGLIPSPDEVVHGQEDSATRGEVNDKISRAIERLQKVQQFLAL